MDFHYIGVLLDMLYNIEMDEEDIEELGLIGWNLIGNKNVKLYKYSDIIDPKDNSITLPCNALSDLKDCVEAVTTQWEDWERVTNKTEQGDNNTSFIEHSIETEKYYQGPYYIPGKLLKYEQVNDKLYFTHNYGKINILYKGILADETGLPQISDKEANAIATYIAYITKFKEGIVTNNTVTINLASSLKNIWLQQCDLARITYLNQNDFNNILDILNSWNRHSYGKTGYKPMI